MHLEAFRHASDEQMRDEEFERGSRLLREAVNEARRLISGLRPPVIDDLGVVAAVEYLINEARTDLQNIEYVHRTTFDRLVPPLESAIFRIVQEALSNVRKHSGSRRARVELIETASTLKLSIRDWGCGFDPATVSRERFGLQGIRQRARLLGTTATIESSPGNGTLIAVDLPLIRAEQDAGRGGQLSLGEWQWPWRSRRIGGRSPAGGQRRWLGVVVAKYLCAVPALQTSLNQNSNCDRVSISAERVHFYLYLARRNGRQDATGAF